MLKTPKTVSLKEFRINPDPTLAALEPGRPTVILRKNRVAFVMVTVAEWNAMCDELADLRSRADAYERIIKAGTATG